MFNRKDLVVKAIQAAGIVRKNLKIDAVSIIDPVEIAEKLGCTVFFQDIDALEVLRGNTKLDGKLNVTNETTEQWQNVITAYNALTEGKRMWFEVWSPNLTKAFYIVAQPPQKLPMPESSQNGLWTMEIPLTIEEYVGLDVAIKPTEG